MSRRFELQEDSEKAEDHEIPPLVDKEARTISKSGTLESFAFLVIGCLNNTGYVVVLTSAQAIAARFNQERFMAIFTFLLANINVLLTLLNSRYLLKIKHSTKIKRALFLSTTAYIVLAISNMMTTITGFSIAILGALIMGVAFTVGELTMLGYLKGFDQNVVNGWSAGTGAAGLFGTTINLLLRHFQVRDHLIFLFIIPTNLIYWMAFAFLENRRLSTIIEEEKSELHERPEEINQVLPDKEEVDAIINDELTAKNLKKVWPKVGYWVTNLGLVFLFESLNIVGFADKSTQKYLYSDDPAEHQAYILLTLFYQFGVVFARSSLMCFKIQKVEILTIIQFINSIIWGYFAYERGVNFFSMLIMMLWVGLMGGMVYCNVVYMILEHREISQSEKEISLNLLNLFNFFGIIGGSLLSFILVNTLYYD